MLKCTDICRFSKEYKPVDNYGTLILDLYKHTYEGTEREDENCTMYMAVDIDSGEVSFWIESETLTPSEPFSGRPDERIEGFEDEIPMDFVFRLMSEGLFEYVPNKKAVAV